MPVVSPLALCFLSSHVHMYLFCGLRAVFVVGDSESHLVGHAFILEFFESSCNKFPSVEGKPNVVGLELPIQISGTKRRSALVLLVTFRGCLLRYVKTRSSRR
jgi:hypothetical protein